MIKLSGIAQSRAGLSITHENLASNPGHGRLPLYYEALSLIPIQNKNKPYYEVEC